MNKIKQKSLGVALCSLAFCASSSAVTTLTGGNIKAAAQWDNGLPDATDDGTISVNGTVSGNFNSGNTVRFANTTVTQDAGTITGIFNTAGAAGLVWNLTGGTIDGSGGNFNANSGAIFNLSGGEVIFGDDLIVNNVTGGFNVGGTATISTANDFDLRLNQDNAFLSIGLDWTGSFVSGNDVTEADWIAELVFGAGPAGSGGTAANPLRQMDVAGTPIDETNFASFFTVTPGGGGGSSLTLTNPVPEPSSALLLGLASLGLLKRRR
ncbi:PEP-CTERM sorting domain-containing protein [Akkermansiaceae bacterium]|nr:PEP-CTERM sorting domain-containing protein [Akkermansiaceae bacterium]